MYVLGHGLAVLSHEHHVLQPTLFKKAVGNHNKRVLNSSKTQCVLNAIRGSPMVISDEISRRPSVALRRPGLLRARLHCRCDDRPRLPLQLRAAACSHRRHLRRCLQPRMAACVDGADRSRSKLCKQRLCSGGGDRSRTFVDAGGWSRAAACRACCCCVVKSVSHLLISGGQPPTAVGC